MQRSRSLERRARQAVPPRRAASLPGEDSQQEVPEAGTSLATSRHAASEAASPESKLRNILRQLELRRQPEVRSAVLKREWDERYGPDAFPFSCDRAADLCASWGYEVARERVGAGAACDEACPFIVQFEQLPNMEPPTLSECDLACVRENLAKRLHLWLPAAEELKRQPRARRANKRPAARGDAAARQPRTVDGVAKLLLSQGDSRCRGMGFASLRAAVLELVKRGHLDQPSGKLTYAVASPQARAWLQRDEATGRLSLPARYSPDEERKAMEVLWACAARVLCSLRPSEGAAGSRSMPWSNLVEELKAPMISSGLCYTRMGQLFEHNSWGDVLKKSLDAKSIFQIGPSPSDPHHHLVRLDLSCNLALAKVVRELNASAASVRCAWAAELVSRYTDCTPTAFEHYLLERAPDDVLRSLDELAAEVVDLLPKKENAVQQRQCWADMVDSDEEEDCLQYQAGKRLVSLDMGGVLLEHGEPLPGARQAVQDLKQRFEVRVVSKVSSQRNRDRFTEAMRNHFADHVDPDLDVIYVNENKDKAAPLSRLNAAAHVDDRLDVLEGLPRSLLRVLFRTAEVPADVRHVAEAQGITVAVGWQAAVTVLVESLEPLTAR